MQDRLMQKRRIELDTEDLKEAIRAYLKHRDIIPPRETQMQFDTADGKTITSLVMEWVPE